MIEKVLVKEEGEQYERELLKEFQQFDERTRNEELRKSIWRLQRLTQEDASNVALKAQLRSKWRKLQSNLRSSPVSTPPESEEEQEPELLIKGGTLHRPEDPKKTTETLKQNNSQRRTAWDVRDVS